MWILPELVHGMCIYIKNVLDNGRKKVHSVISNKFLSGRSLLLLAVVRPALEYGREVWEANNATALESVMLEGAKRILGCSSKTCNEAVRGDTGIYTLQGHKDKNKLEVVV